jgi:hypothetical protein
MGMFELLILGSGRKEVYIGYNFMSEEHVLHSLTILYILSLDSSPLISLHVFIYGTLFVNYDSHDTVFGFILWINFKPYA